MPQSVEKTPIEEGLEQYKLGNWKEASKHLGIALKEMTIKWDSTIPLPNDTTGMRIWLSQLYCHALIQHGDYRAALIAYEQYLGRTFTKNNYTTRFHDLPFPSIEHDYILAYRDALRAAAKHMHPDVFSRINLINLPALQAAIEQSADAERYIDQIKALEKCYQNELLAHQIKAHFSGSPTSDPHYNRRAYETVLPILNEISRIQRKHYRPEYQRDQLSDLDESLNRLSSLAPNTKETIFCTDYEFIQSATQAPDCADSILPAPSRQALIYLLPGTEQYTAVIVQPTPQASEPIIIDLPDARIKHVATIARFLHGAARRQIKKSRCFDSETKVNDRILLDCLHKAWAWIAEPITTALKNAGIQEAVFISAGPISTIPLHSSIREPREGAEFANEMVAYSYAPSARALFNSKQICKDVASKFKDYKGENYVSLSGMASPEPSQLRRLEFAEVEIDIAAARFYYDTGTSWIKPGILKGQLANRMWAAGRLSGEYSQISHFACHARHNFDNPLLSGIFLSSDELFSVVDSLKTRANTRLTVLSCCESGVPVGDTQDAAFSLPTGLMAAGHAGVLSTLWPIYDASAAMLIVRFYYELLDCMKAPARALAGAQSWLAHSRRSELMDFFSEPQAEKYKGRVPDHVYLDILNHYRTFRIAVKSTWSTYERFRKPIHWAGHYLTGV